MKKKPCSVRYTTAKILFCLFVNLAASFLAVGGTGEQNLTFEQKLAQPQTVPPSQSTNVFERQFLKDTGESVATRCTEFDQSVSLGAALCKTKIKIAFNLSNWSADSRSSARIWLAVGATNVISADGTMILTFSQSGVDMATELNNTYNVDGTMILGCDYALKDGEVTVEIENRTHLDNVHCSLHAIVYLPEKKLRPVPQTRS